MGRSELRRAQRKRDAEIRKYSVPKKDIDGYVRERVRKEERKSHDECLSEATNTAMRLMLMLPLEVLIDYYPEIDAQEFTSTLVDYYQMWQDGKFTMEEMTKDLWERGGVRLEETHG